MDNYKFKSNDILISTDISLLNIDLCHKTLSESYWAKGIPRNIFEKSVKNSLCFGVYMGKEQVGFARVVSDYSTFAYLGDVFISEPFKGRGYSKVLIEAILAHPELQGLRRFCLGTHDAHSLYSRYGFKIMKRPENWMEIKIEDIYS